MRNQLHDCIFFACVCTFIPLAKTGPERDFRHGPNNGSPRGKIERAPVRGPERLYSPTSKVDQRLVASVISIWRQPMRPVVRPVVGPGAANICADIEPGPTEHKKPTVLRRSNNLGLANDILE
jgi:hypothetical protein